MSLASVEAIARKLTALPEVEYAEPDYVMRPLLAPNDPSYAAQWHYHGTFGINAPAAWDITTGSASIRVAVIDTGITDHPDLAGRWVGGYDFIADVPTANDGTQAIGLRPICVALVSQRKAAVGMVRMWLEPSGRLATMVWV
jgi:serine protease